LRQLVRPHVLQSICTFLPTLPLKYPKHDQKCCYKWYFWERFWVYTPQT
jgi:hypothetical protein